MEPNLDLFGYNSQTLYSDPTLYAATQSQNTLEGSQTLTDAASTYQWSQGGYNELPDASVFAGINLTSGGGAGAGDSMSQDISTAHPSARVDANVSRRSGASGRGGGRPAAATMTTRRPAALPRRASADDGGGSAALRRAQAENRDLRRQLEVMRQKATEEEENWRVLESLPGRIESMILDKTKVCNDEYLFLRNG